MGRAAAPFLYAAVAVATLCGKTTAKDVSFLHRTAGALNDTTVKLRPNTGGETREMLQPRLFSSSRAAYKARRVLELSSLVPIATLDTMEDDVYDVSLSHDGRQLAATAGNTTLLWTKTSEWQQMPPTLRLSTMCPSRVAWSPDDTLLAIGSGSNVLVYGVTQERDEEKERLILRGSRGNVVSLDWSPDGTKLASAALDDKVVRVWNLVQPESDPFLLEHLCHVRSLAWSPQGGKVAVACEGRFRLHGRGYPQWTVWVWNLAEVGDTLILGWFDGDVTSLAWNPSGSKLAAGVRVTNHKNIWVWDVSTEHVADPVMLSHNPGGAVETLEWSPDGSRLASGASGLGTADNTIRIWEVTENGVFELSQLIMGVPDAVKAVSWSCEGDGLAAAYGDGKIRVWNVQPSFDVAVAAIEELQDHPSIVAFLSASERNLKPWGRQRA